MKLILKSRKLDPCNSSTIQPACQASRALWTLKEEGRTNKTSKHLLALLHEAGYQVQDLQKAFEFIEELLKLNEITTKKLPDLARMGFDIDFSDDSETNELHHDLDRERICHIIDRKTGKLKII